MQSIATWNIGLSLSKENMPRKAIDEMNSPHLFTAPGYLPGGNPVINFSGDLIKVIMPLNLYGLPDKGTVSFTP